MREVYTYDEGKGKRVKAGYIEGDIFHKNVSRKKHYLRIVNGYAIQKDVVEYLLDKQIKEIHIHEDKQRHYMIGLGDFVKNSRDWSYGHGKQRTISEKYLSELDEVGK